MLKKVFYSMLLMLAVVSASKPVTACDTDVDLDDNVLYIETDDQHDLVVVQQDPDNADKILVWIFQYEQPFDLNQFGSFEEAVMAADDFRDERRDLDDVLQIDIRTFGGDDVITVSQLPIPTVLIGGDGNDELYGGSADDLMIGDDEFAGSSAHGDDLMFGFSGNDSMYGGPGEDVLYGGLHDDLLVGDGGNDYLSGSSGDDDMYGGTGNDTMHGGSGEDLMYGSDGADTMNGGYSDDQMYGGRHDDVINGDQGHDEMYGEDGHDEMHGGTGNDEMFGGNGNDELFGEDGSDEMHGGANDDYLDGSRDYDVDIMNGGSGADEFVYRYYDRVQQTSWRLTNNSRFSQSFRLNWSWQQIVLWVNIYREVETVEDYNSAQGDTRTSIRLN